MDVSHLHSLVLPIGRITASGVSLLGSGFILNKAGLIATAAHVTNMDDKNLVVVFSPQLYNDPLGINSYQDTSNTNVQCISASIFKLDSIRDICILKITNQVQSNIRIVSTDAISVSEGLCVVGYPHCNMGRMVLTFQETTVGAKILLQTASIKSKHLVLNIQTRPGQSGSPVFRSIDSALVAMVIGSYAPRSSGGVSIEGVDPLTLHQTTHAVSAEYILKMIQ